MALSVTEMEETEFWWELRVRLNSTESMGDLGYCDWFEPKRYSLGAPTGHIVGKVGFVDGHNSESMPFDLAISGQYRVLPRLHGRFD